LEPNEPMFQGRNDVILSKVEARKI
jgi:hypothetical protein